MVCPTTAFAAWDSTNSCVVLSFINTNQSGTELSPLVQLTRSYDLVVGTFDVFWDLFQVLFSGFISGLEGWGVQVRVGFLSMF